MAATITGWRPRGADRIYICSKCGVVVPPDRDGCPNDADGAALRAELRGDPDAHYLVAYTRADVADHEIASAAGDARAAVQLHNTGIAAIEAAEAALHAAKVALRA